MATLKGQERQKYVADLFSRIAKHYDLMNTLMTFGMHRRWKKSTAKLTCTNLSGVALDIATGTGDLAIQLAYRRRCKFTFPRQYFRLCNSRIQPTEYA